MITFLPYDTFVDCARCLDYRRLGKQRSECKWLLNRIDNNEFRNHPLVRMWIPYRDALIEYSIMICREWRSRGYNDSLLEFFNEKRSLSDYIIPHWLGDNRLHSSHRTKLITKNTNWYRQFNWVEIPNPYIDYYWP